MSDESQVAGNTHLAQHKVFLIMKSPYKIISIFQ
jgi:hypothetical protein